MLPVRAIQEEITATLAVSNRLVLTAPTGSGKTTQVPQMLLGHGAVGGRIIVLQPRRLAARLMATRVAQELGSPLGQRVGYQTRHERVLSEATRVLFMTEGLLLRQMQGDPSLRGIGAVVLDEFHERSLTGDLLVGLLGQLQRERRPDLRLVVMSATLDTSGLSRYLGCPVLEAHGRSFPVSIDHVAARPMQPVWQVAAAAVRAVLEREPEGDVLVFMPGAYEIRRTIEACLRVVGADVSLRGLHGALPPAEQDRALAPSSGRRVIVATNVAETSITIEGVRHVVDSGLARIHRFDPRRGLNVLQTGPISQASATQRAGRAGRTAPGTCLRLWPKQEHAGRPRHDTPEILRLDLAEPMLRLKDLGVDDTRAFPWLDPPEEGALARAEAELAMLHATDERGGLTEIGRQMARLPMHPRLARMLLAANDRGCLGRAIVWAALVSERDIVRGDQRPPDGAAGEDEVLSDLALRERLFDQARRSRFDGDTCRRLGLDAGACRELDRTRKLIERAVPHQGLASDAWGGVDDVLRCLLVAFPDHVAMHHDPRHRRCQLPGHKRVILDKQSVVRNPGPLLALDVRELARGGEATTVLSLCSELRPEWLAEVHPDRIGRRTTVAWSDERQRVEAVEEQVFGELVLSSVHRPATPAQAADVLVQRVQRGELRLEHWDEQVDQWIARTRCVAEWAPGHELVGYDERDMAVILHEIIDGATTAGEARGRRVLDAVRGALSWDDQQLVEKLAPAEVALPSGRRMKLVYHVGQSPRGRAKIQDLYGLDETPRVAAGRVPVRLEILGPNFRPVQVTDDLANFWKTLYPTIRNGLKRRYPKHEWR